MRTLHKLVQARILQLLSCHKLTVFDIRKKQIKQSKVFNYNKYLKNKIKIVYKTKTDHNQLLHMYQAEKNGQIIQNLQDSIITQV